MHFFRKKDQAKRHTLLLLFLLCMGIVSLIAMTVLMIALGSFFLFGYAILDNTMLLSLSGIVLAIVLLSMLKKWLYLKSGGKKVAESLGGRLLTAHPQNADEKKVLNVVEEMALASGVTVPPTYLLEEPVINAFAAGHSTEDAVIGITQGAIEILNRDELQGVIAHEFSHILHGDMKLNLRLVALLHGLLVIGFIGEKILKTLSYGRIRISGGSKNHGALILASCGFGLIAIGYGGTFFGRIIKAAVSRQREYLADASAVQFTRNPTGIANALKKIGGHSAGSILKNPGASEFSHLYFETGVKSLFSKFMATHPPLADRIWNIEPNWDGHYPITQKPAKLTEENTPSTESSSTPSTTKLSLEDMIQVAQDLSSAQALLYSLLIEEGSKESATQRWQQLGKHIDPAIVLAAQKHHTHIIELPRTAYLPLIEACTTTLKQLTDPKYQAFKHNLLLLIKADGQVNPFEWTVFSFVKSYMEPIQINTHYELDALASSINVVLSAVLQAGELSELEQLKQFDRTIKALDLPPTQMLPIIDMPTLDKAVQRLNYLMPLKKPIFLKGLKQCIEEGGDIRLKESELFHAIAHRLNCPAPPLMPISSTVY